MLNPHTFKQLSLFAYWLRAAQWLARAGLLCTLVAALPSLASGQQYQADPVNERVRSQGIIARNLVRNPAAYATERDAFLEYFREYHFPAMTRFRPNELAELGGLRYDLFNQFLWRTTSPEMQKDLTDLAYEKMRNVIISRDKVYHPAVRYNAVLVLGLLDEQYPIDTGANRRPSKPHKESNALLTQIVQAAADGKAVDPTLLVGALIGLERHARFTDALDRGAPAAMTAALLKLAAQEPIAPQADRHVADWIRVQTAAVLATLGSPGQQGEVLSALLKMVAGETDPKLLLDARCQVAALLSRLNFEGATVDGKATAENVLKLASDVVTAEDKEADNFEQLHLRNFGAGPPPKGRAKIDLETREPVYDRRTLLARLTDLGRALETTRTVVPADEQAKYDAVLAAIRPVVDAAANKDEIDLTLAQQVGAMAAAVEQALNPNATPAGNAAANLF